MKYGFTFRQQFKRGLRRFKREWELLFPLLFGTLILGFVALIAIQVNI